jgi:hypothetical protein
MMKRVRAVRIVGEKEEHAAQRIPNPTKSGQAASVMFDFVYENEGVQRASQSPPHAKTMLTEKSIQ